MSSHWLTVPTRPTSWYFSISFVILSGYKACNTLQLEFEIPKLNVSGWAWWRCQQAPYFQRRWHSGGRRKVLAPGGGPYHVSTIPCSTSDHLAIIVDPAAEGIHAKTQTSLPHHHLSLLHAQPKRRKYCAVFCWKFSPQTTMTKEKLQGCPFCPWHPYSFQRKEDLWPKHILHLIDRLVDWSTKTPEDWICSEMVNFCFSFISCANYVSKCSNIEP